MQQGFYVAIDDTDNLESRGTGFRARALADRLEQAGLGTSLGVTRHQLLVDRRIPYTSHNSSACILLVAAGADAAALSAEAAAFLRAEAAPGSDAGLCVAAVALVGEAVVAFGRRAQQEILAAADAQALAAAAGIHLSGHTGEGIGVIGALAAVGLRHGGNDGRFLELRGLRRLQGVVSVADLQGAGIGRFRCENSPALPGAGDLVDVGDWCRPILADGVPTLLLEEVEADGGWPRWRIVARERIKEF